MTVLEMIPKEEARQVAALMGRKRAASASAKKSRRNGKRARKAPEELLQESVCEHLAILEQTGRLLWFHVPNAGKHHISFRVKMKRLGLRAGVPDLCIIPKAGPVCFIELKADKNTPSEHQDYWLERLPNYGCPVAVCRSLDEVQQFLKVHGVIREVA